MLAKDNTSPLDNPLFNDVVNRDYLVSYNDWKTNPYVNKLYRDSVHKYARSGSDIEQIIIHCTATDSKQWDNIEALLNYDLGANHIFKNGCPTCTYHFYVDQSGQVDHAVSVYLKTVHCSGQNNNSVAICINHGGEKDDVIETEQYSALVDTICHVIDFMDWSYSEGSIEDRLHFHRDYSNKLCPGENLNKYQLIADVVERLKTWGDNV